MANLIGQKLSQYEITAKLGSGGMATVYRARQGSVGRDVAIKVIESKLAENPEFIKRFEREAHTIAALSHLHILKLFDFGQHGELIYLVMELLPGGSLADRIRQGPLSAERVSRIIGQLASALDYAHTKGIIHRDLKPQNVLFDEAGEAHLTDFGIAKLLNETTALTASGAAMGTPAYMSPEQWQGRSLDARSDIYALGIMLFEMLSSKLPFNADTPPSMMYMHLNQPPPSIRGLRPDLPGSIDGVINKALAKDPAQRFQTAGDLAKTLKAALTGQTLPGIEVLAASQTDESMTAPRLRLPLKASARRSGRSRALTIGATILIAALGVLMVVLSLTGRNTSPTSPTVTGTEVAAIFTQATTLAQSSFTYTPQQTATKLPSLTPMPPTVTPLPTATLTPTIPTATPSITPNLETLIAATFTQEYTMTLIAVASYTRTPTPTPTATPNLQETLQAAVAASKTANVAASFSKTPTPTKTLTNTATYTLTATRTPTSTLTPTPTFTPTLTNTPTPTLTPSSSPMPYDGGQPSTAPDLKGKTINLVDIPKLVGIGYFASITKGEQEAAAELGNVTVTTDAPTDADIGKQIQYINYYIARGVAGILLSPNDPVAIAPVLKEALSRGIRVISYDADSQHDSRQWFVEQATAEGIGETLVDKMVEETGPEADIAIVTSSLTAPYQTAWIAAMMKYIAERYPRLNVVSVLPSEEDQQLAYNLTLDIIKSHPKIKGVWALSAVAFPGAANAVTDAGKCGQIAVVGLSTPNTMRQFVKSGCVRSVVLWNPIDLGYAAVYVMRSAIDGTLKPGDTNVNVGRLGKLKVDGSNVLLGPPFIFNKDNIGQFDF